MDIVGLSVTRVHSYILVFTGYCWKKVDNGRSRFICDTITFIYTSIHWLLLEEGRQWT